MQMLPFQLFIDFLYFANLVLDLVLALVLARVLARVLALALAWVSGWASDWALAELASAQRLEKCTN